MRGRVVSAGAKDRFPLAGTAVMPTGGAYRGCQTGRRRRWRRRRRRRTVPWFRREWLS